MGPGQRHSAADARRRFLQASLAALGLSSLAARALGEGRERPDAPRHDVVELPKPALPRFHIVDMMSGGVAALVVAGDRGSHGDYLTRGYAFGRGGRSLRLRSLDPAGGDAGDRAVLVHAAWYAGPRRLTEWDATARSKACFAVNQADLPRVLHRLAPGHLLIAAKL